MCFRVLLAWRSSSYAACRRYDCALFSMFIAVVAYLFSILNVLSDSDAAVCEASFWFRDSDGSYTLPTHANKIAYLTACSTAMRSLSESHRGLLRQQLFNGSLDLLLIHRRVPNKVSARVRVYPAKKESVLLKEVRDAAEYKRPGAWPRQEVEVDTADIARAFAEADVVRVNATRMLPSDMFDISAADIYTREGSAQSNVPIGEIFPVIDDTRCQRLARYLTLLAPGLGTSSIILRVLVGAASPLLYRICWPRRTLADVADWHSNRRNRDIPEMPYNMFRTLSADDLDVAVKLWTSQQVSLTANVAAHRLATFASKLDIASRLGLQDDIERVRSSLFMGIASGAFHTDLQDNVLMQLSGESEVFIVPANVSHAWPKHFNGSVLDWLNDPAVPTRQQIPFFHMRLRAGDGVVIPSMSVHKVISRDSRCIRMNAFLEPKLGRMRSRNAPQNGFLQLSDAYMAMRILWLRSAELLHQQKGGGPLVFLFGNTAEVY